LVDLEQRQVVDLLEERTSDVLAKWLKAHPGVEIISHDRSTEYARGAMLGTPNATQVADRWHLLKNLGDCLKDWLECQHKHKFIPYLEQRWREGLTNRKELYREIVSQRFTGSYATVYQYTNDVIGKDPAPKKTRQLIRAKRYTLLDNLRLFSKKADTLSDDEVRHLEHLTITFPEAKDCHEFVQRFHKLVCKVEKHPERALKKWMKEVKKSTVIEL
jgi:Transposase